MEKAYPAWSLEFLRFHRDGEAWKCPTALSKPENEAFLTHRATRPNEAANAWNQAFAAIAFLDERVPERQFPQPNLRRAKPSRRMPAVCSVQHVARSVEYVEGGGGSCRWTVEPTCGAGLRLLSATPQAIAPLDRRNGFTPT